MRYITRLTKQHEQYVPIFVLPVKFKVYITRTFELTEF